MRYYSIDIVDESGQFAPIHLSSLNNNGSFNPGALDIEFDIPITGFATPQSGAYVRIWGVALQDISQAQNLNGFFVSVTGGMSKGLPLANPSQQGILCQGYIFQAYGNWQGTQQSLDLVIYPHVGTDTDKKNIVLNWKKGTSLAQAIVSTMTNAFPGYTVDVSQMSNSLVLSEDQQGYYQTLPQFASFINDASLSINPPTKSGQPYAGVDILLQGKVFKVIDNSGSSFENPRPIAFNDLIGQITWNSPNTLQFNCVLRGDLKVGDYITLPRSQETTVPQSNSRFRQRSAFQGVCRILGGDSIIRHVGNFRQPDANSWITTVNAVIL